MNKRFEIEFLDEALMFLRSLDHKHYEKILYNIGKAQIENDLELLKDKVPEQEIQKAVQIRIKYFEYKQSNKK